MQEITLREVCNMVGVTRRAVQWYERAGLVNSIGKNKYGHLLYDGEMVKKIKTIKLYQNFGFNVKDIKVLFEVSDEKYVEMMNGRVEMMKEELTVIETNIRKAEQMIMEKQK